MFKIWKSNLQGLLEEITGPIYVTEIQMFHQNAVEQKAEIPIVIFAVAAAGFNAEGRVVELCIQQPLAVRYFDEEVRRAAEKNQAVLNELKARLSALGYEIRDGALSTEPVLGVLE